MKKHHQKLKVIEEKIFSGDMDWCNIEIRHSEEAGAQAAFAEILLNPDDETTSNCPREISIKMSSSNNNNNKTQKNKVLSLFRSKRSIS